jgi:hypothetical protein
MIRITLIALILALVLGAPSSASLGTGNGSATPGVIAGSCTNSAGTSCSATVVAGYSTCVAYDQSSPAIPTTCSIAGTTATVTNSTDFTQGGSCTETAGACAAQTYPIAFSVAPVCTAMEVANPPTAVGTVSAPGTAQWTPRNAAGAGTNVIQWHCYGTASASGHVFTIVAG